jgi:hypothetical protein
VVPFASKALWGLGALSVVAAIAYGVATNDSSGGAILAFVATGAILLGVVVVIADPDREPFFVAGAPLSEQTAVGGRPSVPSPWPLIGAVALGALAIGAATDAVVVVIAAILLAVSGVGWLLQTWIEHPTYTGQYAARLKERLLLPVGLPVGVASLVAVIVISLSRIFLALPENGTRAVALAVALVILLSAFAVAASERMARTALTLLIVFAFASLIGAGVAGLVHGERKFVKPMAIPHAPLPPGINPSVTATTAASSG